MNNIDKNEQFFIKSTSVELINYLFEKQLICRNMNCPSCSSQMKMEKKLGFVEDFCWRCYNNSCIKRYKRHSILKNSFFENFKHELRTYLRCICRFAGKQPSYSILKTLSLSRPSLRKLKNKILDLMVIENKKLRKLGGLGKIVHVDETMLNFKCKSHRGRSPLNYTNALCIVECDEITGCILKVWAKTIPNKEARTILPIIFDHVVEFSKVQTDEHKSYSRLMQYGFQHSTVCHKMNFVDERLECIRRQLNVLTMK